MELIRGKCKEGSTLCNLFEGEQLKAWGLGWKAVFKIETCLIGPDDLTIQAKIRKYLVWKPATSAGPTNELYDAV